MVDVDHFKSINDAHGHPAGDAVLKTMARLLTSNLRAGDVCGRIGGEEFALVVMGAGGKQGVTVANRIQRAAREEGTKIAEGVIVRATLSIGVADSASYDSVEQLLVESDRALYDAKNGGRNRVSLAPIG